MYPTCLRYYKTGTRRRRRRRRSRIVGVNLMTFPPSSTNYGGQKKNIHHSPTHRERDRGAGDRRNKKCVPPPPTYLCSCFSCQLPCCCLCVLLQSSSTKNDYRNIYIQVYICISTTGSIQPSLIIGPYISSGPLSKSFSPSLEQTEIAISNGPQSLNINYTHIARQ